MKLKQKLGNIFYSVIKKEYMPYWKEKEFMSFGDGSQIMYPVSALEGAKNIRIGKDSRINRYCRLQCYQDANGVGQISIGDGCYIGFRFTILSGPNGMVKLGDDVLVASDVMISNENHGIDPESDTPYMDQSLSTKSVTIGDGCWIGEKVCILPGVHIGKKCIIGAGSVVTKDVPDYSIAVGNPAKIIKEYDFSKHQWVKVENEEREY